jgi:hypothetical protein
LDLELSTRAVGRLQNAKESKMSKMAMSGPITQIAARLLTMDK